MNTNVLPAGVTKPKSRVRCASLNCTRMGYKKRDRYYCPVHTRPPRVLKDEDRRLLDMLKD